MVMVCWRNGRRNDNWSYTMVKYETECGKEVHYVGKGVCGQDVVQIKIRKGSKKDHDAWRLARVIYGKTCIQLGSKERYKLKERLKV